METWKWGVLGIIAAVSAGMLLAGLVAILIDRRSVVRPQAAPTWRMLGMGLLGTAVCVAMYLYWKPNVDLVVRAAGAPEPASSSQP